MTGALMQLMASGAADISLNLLNNADNGNRYAHEPSYIDFPSHGLRRHVTISRMGDQWKPEYIVIEQSDEDIRLKKVYLEIGGQIVMDFDINFMRQLFPDMIRVRNNKIMYHINFDKFNTNAYINLVSLQFHEVKFGIELTNEYGINSIKLMNDYKFLDSQPRQQMASTSHDHIILQHQSIDNESNNTTANLHFNMHGSTNGFFIEISSGIENIKNLNIRLNNVDYRILDELQLEYLGQIINENMIYLPLTPDTDYLSTDMLASLNMSRIDTIMFCLTGEQALGSIRIHTLSANILRNISGMGGLQFSYGHHSSILTSSTSITQTVTVTIINKVYTGDDDCLISLLEIEEDMHYMECGECNKGFIKEHLEQWLNNSRTCPHCRVPWTSNQVYKNAESEPIEEESELIDEILEIEEDEPIITRSSFGGFLSRVIPFVTAQ